MKQLAKLKPGRKAPGPGVGYTVAPDLSFIETVQAHLRSSMRTELKCLRLPGAIDLAESYLRQLQEACKTVTQLPECVRTRISRGPSDVYRSARQVTEEYEFHAGPQGRKDGPFKFLDSVITSSPSYDIGLVVDDVARGVSCSELIQAMGTVQIDPSLWAAERHRLKKGLDTICSRFRLFDEELDETSPLGQEDAFQKLDDLERIVRFSRKRSPEQEVADQLQTLYRRLGSTWLSDKSEELRHDALIDIRTGMSCAARTEFDDVNIINATKISIEDGDADTAKRLIQLAQDYHLNDWTEESRPTMHQMLRVVKDSTQEGLTDGRQGPTLADHVFQKVLDWYVAGSWKPQSTASGSATADPSTAGPSSRPV